MTTIRPLQRALISVSDKTGLLELAAFLSEQNVEILSTGGTAKALRDGGIEVIDVSEVTGFPEILDGRVKTLHPKVHGAILGKASEAAHKSVMDAHSIAPIDLVIVNLYPFEATLAAGGSYEDCVENIDIGGPAMIRAAAKNHDHVTIITDSEDYAALIKEAKANGGTSDAFRKQQAQIAYARTAAYDAAISTWLAKALAIETPRRVVQAAKLASTLRYGENPHQGAAFYLPETTQSGFGAQNLVQGKELSYNNLNDADAAYGLIREFTETPACAIIKHANPCGVATGETLLEAYQSALACDPVSAFGGIIAVNRPLDEATANAILELFTEVVICPAIDDAARQAFERKPNIRLLVLPFDAPKPTRTWREIDGGFLVQDADNGADDPLTFETVTKRAPTDKEMSDLIFAWRVAKHVKSNAIVYCKDGRTVGVGAGQMSRVDSARIAVQKSKDMAEASNGAPTKGAVVASDAFFPFADGLLQAAEAGVTAVIQPGGSMRDDEVIAAANEHNLAMVFTGRRHFRH